MGIVSSLAWEGLLRDAVSTHFGLKKRQPRMTEQGCGNGWLPPTCRVGRPTVVEVAGFLSRAHG